MSKFWMVYRSGGDAPTQKHNTYESAEAEAERLSIKHSTDGFMKFEILECVGSFIHRPSPACQDCVTSGLKRAKLQAEYNDLCKMNDRNIDENMRLSLRIKELNREAKNRDAIIDACDADTRANYQINIAKQHSLRMRADEAETLTIAFALQIGIEEVFTVSDEKWAEAEDCKIVCIGKVGDADRTSFRIEREREMEVPF